MKHAKILITGLMISSMWYSGCSKLKPQTSKEKMTADVVSDGVNDYIRIPLKDVNAKGKGKISNIKMLDGKFDLLSAVIINGCDPEAVTCEDSVAQDNKPEDPTFGNGTAMATPKFDNEDPTKGGGQPIIPIDLSKKEAEFALLKISHENAPKEYKDAIASAKSGGDSYEGCNDPSCTGIDPKFPLELELHYTKETAVLGLSGTDKQVEIIKVIADLNQK